MDYPELFIEETIRQIQDASPREKEVLMALFRRRR
jgi:hypothetical protein